MVYKKAGTLSVKDADPAASLTLMSADIERIVQGWQTIHDIWGNTLEIALAIFLLERELGVSCVVPVGVSLGKHELYLVFSFWCCPRFYIFLSFDTIFPILTRFSISGARWIFNLAFACCVEASPMA